MLNPLSGVTRFIAQPHFERSAIRLGFSIIASRSLDPMGTEDAHRLFVQLVVSCDDQFEQYDWTKLGTALSGMRHAIKVDFLFRKYAALAESTHAILQACIPNTIINLHTVPGEEASRFPDDIIQKFWKQMDGDTSLVADLYCT